MTSRKQFLGGGAASSQPWGNDTLGPGDLSGSDSSPTPAPLRQSQEVPHLSLASSAGAANWHRLGDLCFPLDSDDLRGDVGALIGLGDALTGDVVTFTGDCRDRPRSVVPFNIAPFRTVSLSLLFISCFHIAFYYEINCLFLRLL